jgi:hypothetical protein
MRRGMEIRVAFAPTRLSPEHLRAVYELVTPVIERSVVRRSEDVVEEGNLDIIEDAQQRKREAR